MLRYDRCRSCGIRWHREHGFELGPIALNVVFTFFTLGVSMIIAFVATAPDFPVVALTVGLVTGAILIPLIAYPFTFMLWQAFDLALPPARRARTRRGGGGGRTPLAALSSVTFAAVSCR